MRYRRETAAVPNRRFVMLDRDGTLIEGLPYLSDPAQVQLLPGVGAGLRALRELGLGLCLVTNQSGVERGYFSLETLELVHKRLGELLAEQGVKLDAIYYCPHVPEQACRCRKPEPGLVERAVNELALDPLASFVVGDNQVDVELGQRIGATTILVRTGYGAQVAADPTVRPDHVVGDLAEASRLIQRIVSQEKQESLT